VSEWKFCLDCHHSYERHPENPYGVRVCVIEECDCFEFYNTVENLL
jgi:hypothetical protein